MLPQCGEPPAREEALSDENFQSLLQALSREHTSFRQQYDNAVEENTRFRSVLLDLGQDVSGILKTPQHVEFSPFEIALDDLEDGANREDSSCREYSGNQCQFGDSWSVKANSPPHDEDSSDDAVAVYDAKFKAPLPSGPTISKEGASKAILPFGPTMSKDHGESLADALSQSISPGSFSLSGTKRPSHSSQSPVVHRTHQSVADNFVLSGSFHDGNESDEGTTHKFSWRSIPQMIVGHSSFEIILASLIMANAILMSLEVQYRGLQLGYDLNYRGHREEAHVVWARAAVIFEGFGWVFGIVFTLEVVLKVAAFDLAYLIDPWSWVDICCVLAFLAEPVLSRLMPGNNENIQMLRLIRLIRLVRLIRTMEGLGTLYLLMTAIREMNRILAWAIALLSVMLMMCALCLTQVLHALYFDGSQTEAQTKLFEYFGTFTRSMFSMFELTLANYPPAARLLSEEVSEWFMILSVLHKLTIGFAVVGVINGVIFQETLRVANTNDMIMVRNKRRVLNMLRKKLTALFTALDQNGDGSLDFEEFGVIAGHPEVKTWLSSMDVETHDLKLLFTLIDEEKKGEVTIDELIDRIPRLQGAARSMDLLALSEMLKNKDEADFNQFQI